MKKYISLLFIVRIILILIFVINLKQDKESYIEIYGIENFNSNITFYIIQVI